MNNHRILFIPILLTIISLAACSAPDTDAEPAAAPGFERSTQALPPPPGPDEDETFVVVTPPVITQEPADPFEGLTFKNGWAKIPFNSTIFGGYGTDQMNDVTAGGPGVVIVGFNIRNGDMNADVWYSQDGIQWTRAEKQEDLGGEGAQTMNAVAAGPNGLVAVGMETINNQSNAAVWFSKDGISWSRIPEIGNTFGDQDTQVMKNITAFADGFVAVGFERTADEIRGAVWVSSNGVAWRRVSHSEEIFGGINRYVSLEDVIPVGDSLLATGTIKYPDQDDVDTAVWFSHDSGKSWTYIKNAEASLGDPQAVRYQIVSGIDSANNMLYMVGTEKNTSSSISEQYINGVIWRSEDGLEWERIFEHKPDYHLQTMSDIVRTELGIVIVGFDIIGEEVQAAAWISPDGLRWDQVPHFESLFGGPGIQRMNAAAEAGPGVVVVGTSNELGGQDAVIWIYVPEK